MKKLFSNLLQKLKEIEDDTNEKRIARRAAMSKNQKVGEVAIWAAFFSIMGIGIAAHALPTAFMMSFPILVLLRLTYNQSIGPIRIAKYIAAPVALTALPGFLVAIFAVNEFRDYHSEATNLALKNTELVAEDANFFLSDMNAGLLGTHELGSMSGLTYSKNDPLIRPLLDASFRLGVFGRGSVSDYRAAFPVLDFMTSSDSVILFSRSSLLNLDDRTDAFVESRTSKNKEDLSLEEYAEILSSEDRYSAMIMMTCIFGADGEILTMSGGPMAMFLELRNIPKTSPMVEVCEAFAPGKVRPETIGGAKEAFAKEGEAL